jgi:hypothetical protein
MRGSGGPSRTFGFMSLLLQLEIVSRGETVHVIGRAKMLSAF